MKCFNHKFSNMINFKLFMKNLLQINFISQMIVNKVENYKLLFLIYINGSKCK